MTRQHRNEVAYPSLWRAVDGAIRDAVAQHPDIQIPPRRRASIVKRVVGAVLAEEARAARAAERPEASLSSAPAASSNPEATQGRAYLSRPPHTPDRMEW